MRATTATLAVLLLLTALGGGESRHQPRLVQQVTPAVVHGEGPHWDDRQQFLYFVDIDQQLLNRYNPSTGIVTHIKLAGGGVTLVVPITASGDEFIVTRGRDIGVLTWDGTNGADPNFQVIATVDADKPDNRFNDGKADRSGRMWAGTMGPEKIVGQVTPDQGSFFSINPNSIEPVNHLSPVSISNGLAWTADNKVMYYIDTATQRVDAFDFDIEQGAISNRRPAFDLAANNITGSPDGMTIDSDDNIWVAVFDGGKVLHVDPRKSKLLDVVDIPASRVTSVTFGGDGLQTLFVTTSRLGLTDEELQKQPLAGSVFAVTGLGIRGTRGNTAIRTEL